MHIDTFVQPHLRGRQKFECLNMFECVRMFISCIWVWLILLPPAYCPFQVTDYLSDAPLLLQLLARGLGTMGGLVWLFLFRVALCCVGTMVSISSPPVDTASSSSSPMGTDPSLCGLLGALDDLVVVILILICVLNINQQMVPERGSSPNATTSQGLMGSTL